MPTVSDIVSLARRQLTDTGASPYWSDNELATLVVQGASDLWREIVNIDEDYYLTVKEDFPTSRLFLPKNTPTVEGTPSNLFKLKFLEPLNSEVGLSFSVPDGYDDPGFATDRHRNPVGVNEPEPSSVTVLGAPPNSTINVYPPPNFDLPLRMAYVKSIETDLLDNSSASEVEIDEGRSTLFSQTVSPGSPVRQRFIRINDFRLPRSDDGQLIFGLPGGGGAVAVSPIFQWAAFRAIEPSTISSLATTSNSLNLTVPYVGIDETIIDTAVISLGRTTRNELLMAVDSELAATNIFPIEPLTIHRLSNQFGVEVIPVQMDAEVEIPGSPTRALVSWTVGYALAKPSERKTPDVTWLNVYGAEKDNIVQSLTGKIRPRTSVAEAAPHFNNNSNSSFALPF